MAIAPRDVGVTRDQVSKWLKDYKTSHPNMTLEEYLRSKLDDPDMAVDTSGHDDRGASTPLIEMILADLDSYA